jgi:hypothetical protein
LAGWPMAIADFRFLFSSATPRAFTTCTNPAIGRARRTDCLTGVTEAADRRHSIRCSSAYAEHACSRLCRACLLALLLCSLGRSRHPVRPCRPHRRFSRLALRFLALKSTPSTPTPRLTYWQTGAFGWPRSST